MHEPKKRRKYDAVFKSEPDARSWTPGGMLRMVDSGQSVSYTAEALGISEALIYGWKKQEQSGKRKIGSPERSID